MKKLKKLVIFIFCIVNFIANNICAEAKSTQDYINKIKSDPKFELVDKIEAIVYSTEGTAPVLLSDLKVGMDGNPIELETEVDKRRVLFDAKKYSIDKSVPESKTEEYLDQVIKANNLSKQDIAQMFNKSFEQVKETLRENQIYDATVNYRSRASTGISIEEIEQYYNNNPVYMPAQYILKLINLPRDKSKSVDEQVDALKKEKNKLQDLFDNCDSITLEEKDLSSDKLYITKLETDNITFVSSNEEDLVFVQLVSKNSKRLVPLETRKTEIENLLKKEKYEVAVKEYKDKLKTETTVKYAN